MGLMKNLLLIAGGAAAGYLATRAKGQTSSQDLELKTKAPLQNYLQEGGPVANFFDSPYGQPLKATALRAISFAAAVKAGMDEKEAELKDKLDRQTRDPRPGSLDTWDSQEISQSRTQDVPAYSLEGQTLDSPENQTPTDRRIARDAELGKDFFA
ncbi:peptide chain release factor 4 [Rothia nasimurium]|uniref:peptide chain release factor 4 n=1 Tax=Rothia nasimurium TaxID=85336 RepID=UPI003B9F92EA